MDRIINLHDFYAQNLDERMANARREFPGIKVIYVGRTQKGSTIATSPLHNGNWLSKEDEKDPVKRAKSIADFKLDLWKKIKEGDRGVMDALNAIEEETILACWCFPLPCHSQVIWSAWHWLKSKERARLADAVLV